MKAALASALAYHPKLIVLDEPFGGLDPLVRDELIEALLERATETTIFISSHDLAEVESFTSHVGYIENGQLRFSEDMGALTARFREVEVTLGAPAGHVPPWPGSWLRVTQSASVVQFIESRFDSERTPQEIQRIFAEVRDATFEPMTLRPIFLAMARSERDTSAGAPAMNPRRRQVLHIFRKDARHFWIEILASFVLLTTYAWRRARILERQAISGS